MSNHYVVCGSEIIAHIILRKNKGRRIFYWLTRQHYDYIQEDKGKGDVIYGRVGHHNDFPGYEGKKELW